MEEDSLEKVWDVLKKNLYFPRKIENLQYRSQWKLFDQAAGKGIFDGIQDISDYKNSYNFILHTEIFLISKALNKAKTILDLGCGMGHPAVHIANLGRKIICVDRAPRMVRSLRKELKTKLVNIFLVQCDASMLGVGSKKFDLVYLCTSLSAMDNPQKTLCEIRRVLKPFGSVIVLEPNILYLAKNDRIRESIKKLPSGNYFYSCQEIITDDHLLITFGCELKSNQSIQDLTLLERRDKSLFCSSVIREHCQNASADIEWRFSPSKLEYMLENAGFQKVEVYGYGFFKNLVRKGPIIVTSSDSMKKLCELEASFVQMLNPKETEMIYCKARAPGRQP